jgi:Flp pilus assembly protein TadG
MRIVRIVRDQRAVGAIEFALITPVLFMIILGIAQMGILFFANAGLKHAVAEGARFAALHPRPTATDIRAKILQKKLALRANRLGPVVITPGTNNGSDFLDVSLTYSVPLNFVFVKVPPVTLREQRRVFIYPEDG